MWHNTGSTRNHWDIGFSLSCDLFSVSRWMFHFGLFIYFMSAHQHQYRPDIGGARSWYRYTFHDVDLDSDQSHVSTGIEWELEVMEFRLSAGIDIVCTVWSKILASIWAEDATVNIKFTELGADAYVISVGLQAFKKMALPRRFVDSLA